MWVDFWMSAFFDLEQLVSSDHHLVYFKGIVIFLESELPLSLDDFIVAFPYSMVTITNLFQMGLWPEATFSNAARGPYFLPECLVGRNDGCLLGIWTHEAVPESVALSFELLLESDSLPLWSASSPLTSTAESLSWSTLFPEASAANLSLGSAAALTGLEGRLMSSGSCCSGLWMVTGWMSWVLYPLLMLPFSVPAQALFPLWPSGVLPGEWSHFFCLRPRESVKNGCLTGVLTAGISNIWITGGKVLTWHGALLMDTGPVVSLSVEEVSQVKRLSNTMQKQRSLEIGKPMDGHPLIPQRKIAVKKDLPWAHHNNQKLLADAEMMIVTSCKKGRRH